MASEDWQIAADGEKPGSLIVQLRRETYVLPWFRFVYAAGDNETLRIAFASHSVTVEGSGLAALAVAVAGQRVVRLIEPTQNEAKFGVRGVNATRINGPMITSMTVEVPE